MLKSGFKPFLFIIILFFTFSLISGLLSYFLLKIDNESKIKNESGEYIINILNDKYAAWLLAQNKNFEDEIVILREKQKNSVNKEEYKKLEKQLIIVKKQKENNEIEYKKALKLKKEYEKSKKNLIDGDTYSDLETDSSFANNDSLEDTKNNQDANEIIDFLNSKGEKNRSNEDIYLFFKKIYEKLYKNIDDKERYIKKLKNETKTLDKNIDLMFEYLPDVKGVFIETDGKIGVKLNPNNKWNNGIYVVYEGRNEKKKVVSKVEIIADKNGSFTINKIMPYQLPKRGNWF
ncbi:MAG TPA: hypothetical protein PLO89_00225 [Spirochaetota bacterium]|nr:hypothetical protein [Spirochaetota bacterium]